MSTIILHPLHDIQGPRGVDALLDGAGVVDTDAFEYRNMMEEDCFGKHMDSYPDHSDHFSEYLNLNDTAVKVSHAGPSGPQPSGA